MKVLRYSAIAAVAMFAAACGDKVTVAGPTAVTLTSTTTTTTTTTPVAPGKINSIAVAPAAVTLTIGQAVTLVAAVNADPGVATTVTWSTSDATKVTVVAGLVTAVAATPGVAICATSTVNVGVKGCASAVVVAASATVPATASIAGVYVTNVSTPVTPSNVSGPLFVTVNVEPGTETISKVYLKIGTVVADSQVFSAAQSAALRNAVETANETGAQAAGENMANATSSIMLTANTAAYNATTGAVSYANGTAALSVQLFVAGNTAARSTATYSSNLTLNNDDVVYGAWTLPSTYRNATDAAGYQWTSLGGGAALLKVTPVLYSGKTVSTATIKFPSQPLVGQTAGGMGNPWTYCTATGADATVCTILPSTADTAINKTVAAAGLSAVSFGLYDREFVAGSTTGLISVGIAPTVSMVFSDGTSLADRAFTNATAIAMRHDNRGPQRPSLAAPYWNNAVQTLASTQVTRPIITFGVRATSLVTAVSTLADSAKVIQAYTATGVAATGEVGVSAGHTIGSLAGVTFRTFRNAGGTASATLTDTIPTYATEIAANGNLVGLAETGTYCVQVRSYDALLNASPAYGDGSVKSNAVVAESCNRAASYTNGQLVLTLDATTPVLTWASANYASIDTAVASIAAGADFKTVNTETNAGSVVSLQACLVSASGTTITSAGVNSLSSSTCSTYVTQGTWVGQTTAFSDGTNIFASSSLTGNGVYRLRAYVTDAAGNIGATIVRMINVDGTAPTVGATTTPAATLGTAQAPAAFLNDNVDLYAHVLTTSQLGGWATGAGARNAVYLSGLTRVLPILEGTPTVIGAAIGVPVSTRFFNVSVTGSSTIQYLLPVAVDGTALSAQDMATTTSAVGPNDNIALLGHYRTQYQFRAYDQYARTAIGVVGLGSIPDSLNATNVSLTSRLTMANNGFISGVDATVYASGTAPSGVITVARTAALAAANAGFVNSKALVLTYVKNRYADQQALVAYGITTGTYCRENLAAATLNTFVSGAASLTSQATSTPTVTAAPTTVAVYAPVGAASAGTHGYVGNMTLVNTVSNAGTAGATNLCDDTETLTYNYTWNLTSRYPFSEWSNGQLIYVITGTKGQGTIIRGPFVDIR